jgi:dipeptidyl-peptidase-4
MPTTTIWARCEVEDQLTGIEWLGQQNYVDAKRIGVFG